ncbi:MAG: DinB family protein [Candidatus Eiseniibacteriota bacterium]
MNRIESLLAELAHEAQTTRRYLERLSERQFDWRPHAKSFTAGQLASHLVDCIRWITPIFAADELDMGSGGYEPFCAKSSAELLASFDAEVAKAQQAMAGSTDTSATGPWRFKMHGKVWFEKPREDVFRDMTVSHLIHHRGQLSVYLRLLEVPVPGSYGPTADEGG